MVTWSGSVWKVDRDHGLPDYFQLEDYIRCAITEKRHGRIALNSPNCLRQVEGEYVIAAADKWSAILARGLQAESQLFYKYEKGVLQWSTNFMDLVDSPINDLIWDKLVLQSWGIGVLPFRNIHSLENGKFVEVSEKGLRTVTFEHFNQTSITKWSSLQEWGEYAYELITHAVAVRARPFRRVGVALSAGIDSSAIVSCLARSKTDIVLYNWASRSWSTIDESKYASKTAEYLGQKENFRTIDVSQGHRKGGGHLSETWRPVVPINNGLYKWWIDTVELAEKDGVDCFMTGRCGNGAFCNRIGINLLTDLMSVPFLQGCRFVWHSLSTIATTRSLLKTLLPLGIEAELEADLQESVQLGPWPVDRHIDHYSQAATDTLTEQKDLTKTEVSMQRLNMDIQWWRPKGIVCLAPYYDRNIWFGLRPIIPSAYKLLPYGGRVIDKPILRQAFLNKLPSEVVSNKFQANLGAAKEWFVINNRDFVSNVLSKDSNLAKLGVIEPKHLQDVLASKSRICKCAGTLTNNVLIELWLRKIFADIP